MKPYYLYTFNILFTLAILSGCNKEQVPPIKPTTPTFQPINFGTKDYGSMEDIEGNTYKTIQIGSAIWMAQNLRTSKNNDGVPIDAWIDLATWRTTPLASYYYYEGSTRDVSLYGYLYNAAAKNSVCPTDWHLPTESDWQGLVSELGGKEVAGGKMKEEGTAHWGLPNSGADNSSGFTGMPGGSIHLGVLSDVSQDGYWWSAEGGAFYYVSASKVEIRNKDTALAEEGIAIRCVKN